MILSLDIVEDVSIPGNQMSQVEIRLLNVTSTIHGVDAAHDYELDKEMSYTVDGAFFSPMYRRGRWDGKKHLYKTKTTAHPFGKFPTGLYSRVMKVLQDQFPTTTVTVTDQRNKPRQQHPLMLTLPEGRDLHDFQQETINLAAERARGLFRLPTGAGKSLAEAAVIARLNVPTIVMSHRWEILEHLKEEAEAALGFEIGVIGQGQKKLMRFNVAMIQTIASCMKREATSKPDFEVMEFIRKKCECLIVDEAHHTSSDTYFQLSNKAFNAYYRFGFSATPYRGGPSDMLVEAGFGKIQISVTPSHLIREKKLSKPYIFFVDYGDTSSNKDGVDLCQDCGSVSLEAIQMPVGKGKRLKDDDLLEASVDVEITRTVYKCLHCFKLWTTYADATVRCLVRNDKRNAAIAKLAAERIRRKKSVLIVVTYIEHGQEIENRIKQLVDPNLVQFVQGSTPDKKGFLNQLARKEKMCLIATNVFGEGVDVPSLDTLINAKASGSVIDTIQVVGRALRRAKGKWKAVVIDFQDKSDYFKARTKFRMKLLKEEPEFVVKKLVLP